MFENEKISVVIPVYKVEKYLKKCVDSVRNQTYENLEIILVDDGSPDNCGKMCDELAQSDERIKVVHKENAGLSAARNTGIENATGRYICFIDSDDFLSEDFCEVLYDAVQESGSDVASVALSMVREDGYKINTSDDLKEVIKDNNMYTYVGNEILKQILYRKTFKNYVCTKLYKKEILESCKFKEGVNYEDVLFMYEISKKINKITFVNKECYFYLKRYDSITATCSEKNLNDFLDVVTYRYEEIDSKGNLDKYNMYALLESIISISIKYIISKQTYETVDKKSEYIFEKLKQYLNNYENEIELLKLLNSSEKACLYLLKYNTELFYSFLKERQKLKIQGKIV